MTRSLLGLDDYMERFEELTEACEALLLSTRILDGRPFSPELERVSMATTRAREVLE